MAQLHRRSSPPAAASFVCLFALAASGCGPVIELETDASSATADDDASTSNDTSTSNDPATDPTLGDTTDGPMPLDLGDPPPSQCPAGAGDLEPEWTVSEPGEGRADAVAVGAGRVAWATGEFFDSHVRVLDLDGNPLWDQPVPLWGGEGEVADEDLAIDPSGAVIVAGRSSEGALLRWYDSTGALLAEDLLAVTTFDGWNGLALLEDGDAVAVGASNDELFVRRYTPRATPVWSQGLSENGAIRASDVVVTATGTILVSGHSNTIPGPVLLAYDEDGALQWSRFDEDGGTLELAWGVAADSSGGAWLATISDDPAANRVERFDQDGNLDSTIILDFLPSEIAIDIDDSIVVVGAILTDGLVIVERRDANGQVLARHERPGRRAMGVAVDEDCHTYVAGYTDGGEAWLDKLR